MIKLSKRFLERAKAHLRKYRKILESARTRDVGESDTVVIVTDFLHEVLGYAKYDEITTEHAIRSTFCDLAIKVDGRLAFLIEVKAIGLDLKDNHLRQAIDYAANEGAEWAVLTNGSEWQVHRVCFEKPIRAELVLELSLLDTSARPADLVPKLGLLSREAISAGALGRYCQTKEASSRFVVGQVLVSPIVSNVVRRALRKLSPKLRITPEQVAGIIRDEVLKREVLEGHRATSAERMVRKLTRKRERSVELPAPAMTTLSDVEAPEEQTT